MCGGLNDWAFKLSDFYFYYLKKQKKHKKEFLLYIKSRKEKNKKKRNLHLNNRSLFWFRKVIVFCVCEADNYSYCLLGKENQQVFTSTLSISNIYLAKYSKVCFCFDVFIIYDWLRFDTNVKYFVMRACTLRSFKKKAVNQLEEGH